MWAYGPHVSKSEKLSYDNQSGPFLNIDDIEGFKLQCIGSGNWRSVIAIVVVLAPEHFDIPTKAPPANRTRFVLKVNTHITMMYYSLVKCDGALKYCT